MWVALAYAAWLTYAFGALTVLARWARRRGD